MQLRDYQTDAIAKTLAAWQDHTDVLGVAATGAGKAQPLTASILTPEGWTVMGEIVPGVDVIGSNGQPTRVLAVFPQGEIETYAVHFSDGSFVECCADHLWQVQTKSQKSRKLGWQVKPLRELYGDLADGSGARKWFVPIVAPVAFTSQPVPLDPYVLGILIGDGNLHQTYEPATGGSAMSFVRMSSADQFIVNEVSRRLDGIATLKYLSGYDYAVTSGRTGRGGSPVANALRLLGLMGHRSYEKFIPAAYLYNDIETRLTLLRGLMDSDGEGGSEGRAAVFNTTSRRLADDVCELVRSLGGVTSVHQKAPGIYTHNGERRTGRASYRVRVSIPFNPFLLPRKAETYNETPVQGRTKAIVSIEPIGKQVCQCILVDNPDHLYVADGYTLTHNTVIFIKLLTDLMDQHPGARCCVLAHREELIHQPIERLRAVAGEWLMSGTLERPRVGLLLGEQKDYDRQLTIATVQTLGREKHLNALLSHGQVDYLITDEAHHAVSPSYLRVVAGLRAANPTLRHLGVTATPQRGDGLGLANGFSTTAFTVTITDLVRRGYLVKPSWYAISTQIDLSGVKTRAGDFEQNKLAERFDTDACRQVVIAAHKEYAADRPAIAFTVSVAGAYALAEAFRDAGFSAAAADGTTDKAVRRQILADFRAGKFQVLVNCGLWTEGLDVPEIACIHLARPTRSDGLYIQMVGRGLRPVPGKTDCLILDYLPADARNVAMLGDILGCPIPRDELLKQFQKRNEQGATQIGFTFDGDDFEGQGDAAGVNFQIVAKELHYLEASLWTWHRRDGLLTLGCGRGGDGRERILAIRGGQLWGIWRDGEQIGGEWRSRGMWVARPLPAEDPFMAGEQFATKHASADLVAKGRSWHKMPISEGQARFLASLARGQLKRSEIELLSRGDAANLISHYQAVQAIGRYEAALSSNVMEAVA